MKFDAPAVKERGRVYAQRVLDAMADYPGGHVVRRDAEGMDFIEHMEQAFVDGYMAGMTDANTPRRTK